MADYEFSLMPVTYIHIGNGETLDPTEYIVKNGKLFYLNQTQMVSYLMKKDRTRFENILNTADMIKITDFFIQNFDENNKLLWKASYPVDSQFENEYNKTLHNPANQNLLYQFIRNEWQAVPFIPGSSLKGAIRTAFLSYLLNEFDKKGGDTNKILYNSKLELILLNAKNKKGEYVIEEDPFKYFKVPDISFPNESLNVKKVKSTALPKDQSINYYQSPRKIKTEIPAYHEVMDYDRTKVLQGKIIIQDDFWKKTKTTPDILIKAINEFYLNAYKRDKDFYDNLKLISEYNEIRKLLSIEEESVAVIKIGKGSGKDYITYEILKQFNNYKQPKSRNLIENQPMGWCILKFKACS